MPYFKKAYLLRPGARVGVGGGWAWGAGEAVASDSCAWKGLTSGAASVGGADGEAVGDAEVDAVT